MILLVSLFALAHYLLGGLVSPAMVASTALSLAVIWLAVKLWRHHRAVALLKRLPGPPPGWPLIGHIPLFTKDLEKSGGGGGDGDGDIEKRSTMEAMYRTTMALNREYGREGIFHVALGPNHAVMLTKGATAEQLLVDGVNIVKDNAYHYLADWWRTGLLTSAGEKWHRRRKMITPAFHFQALRDFLPIMNRHAGVLVDKLGRLADADPLHRVDAPGLLTRTALDVIGETSMGIGLDSQRAANEEYLRAIKIMGDTAVSRGFGPLHYKYNWTFRLTAAGAVYRKAVAHLRNFTMRVIQERKARLLSGREVAAAGSPINGTDSASSSSSKRKAMPLLDILLKFHLAAETAAAAAAAAEASRRPVDGFSLEDVHEETEQFMFAGHDTTAHAMAWALFCLGNHPECQARVQEELDGIFAGDDPGRPVTAADLTEMAYLEMCLRESMRRFATVPHIARQLVRDMTIGGYRIPAGTSVNVMLYLVHSDPDVFPEPGRFDPERFAPAAVAARGHFDFLPFSAGPRNCIGQRYALMEAKTVLAQVLRSFTVRAQTSMEAIRVEPSMVLHPVGGMLMTFTRREK